MKHFILPFLLSALLILNLNSFAQSDTLFNYDMGTGFSNQSATYTEYVSVLDLPYPGMIEQLLVTLGGTTGSVTVHLYGHEGGIPWPEVGKDLITPVVLNKTSGGTVEFAIDLSTNGIFLEGDQLMIGITDISAGIVLKMDVSNLGVLCSSALGGDRYPAYNFNGTQWVGQGEAYRLAAVVNFPSKTPSAHFTNITPTSGIPTNIGGNRISAADYNNDGWVDLLIEGHLCENDGSGGFNHVSASKGITTGAKAHAFVDHDNDGDLDILALNLPDNSSVVYLNDSLGNFTTSPLVGFPVFPALNSLSIGHLNTDHYPDLHIGQLWTTYPDPEPKYVFHNNGGTGFTDTTKWFYGSDTVRGASRGSQFVDYNNDGLSDLFVANYVTYADRVQSPRDELWKNNGDGTFTNVIGESVIDSNQGNFFWNYSSGCAWADYDHDGNMDLLAPALSHPRNMNGQLGEYTQPTTIYRNSGAPNYGFTDMKSLVGLEFEETHSGGVWGDVDNDGDLDFFITAFYECRTADLYLQQPFGNFDLGTWDWGLSGLDSEQDALFVDIDNDGDLDLLCVAGDGLIRLFENGANGAGNWVSIQPWSTDDHHYAIGARVEVWTQSLRFTQEVSVGQGQKMQRPYRLHFGIGNATTIDSVVVKWPGQANLKDVYTGLAINQHHQLKKYEGDTTSNPIGIETLDQELELTLFPNPFDDRIQLNVFIEETAAYELSIYSVDGRLIEQLQLQLSIGNRSIQYVPSYPDKGVYWIELSQNGRRLAGERLIRQ